MNWLGQDQKNYTRDFGISRRVASKGHTIVMITHDMQLMLDYSGPELWLWWMEN